MSLSKVAGERDVPAAVARYVRSSVRSTREVFQYLCRRGVPARQAGTVVSACQAQGLLDDRAAARLWANHWARHGYAAAAIRLKLADKAFDERDIREAIHPLHSSTAEEERARLVLAHDARRRSRRPSRARLARLLASRGFDSDLIERVLSESFDPATATPSPA